ncbi:kelch repeat-containing protein, partial [Methanoregula sp.]|uniref:kelch repeat-containing protein n=1 Tax=Methanoregula sp. TaxID=2052170 RepID=UPI003567FEAF
MKFLTIKRFNGKLILLLIILAFVGIPSVSAYDDTIIGFRWNTSDSSPRLYQIDATGEVIANKPATFWNNDWNITANMKTVVVNASNTTPVLYGTNNRGDGLDLNGTYGDVMVEIPVFYTKSTFENGNFSYWISPLPSAGFAVAPMFNQRGTGTNAGTAAPYYYVGRYDANLTGSKLQSATGKAPAVSITINQARTYAENKGAGWGITNIWTLSGLRQLFYTEMLTLDSQTAWTGSRGIVDGNSAVFISGADGIDTAIYTINATGNGTGLNGKTPVSYRGIENLWGNVWQFQDGFTAIKGANNVSVINATGLGLTGQKTTFAIPLGANDGQSVGELLIADGNQTNLLNTDVARPLFLPSAVGGSSTTYLSDYYYYPRSISAADPNILLSGGSWAAAGLAGVGALGTITYASDSLSSVGARLEFRRSAAAPTVTVIDPNSGVNTGSVTVTITGTNFQTGSATTLNLTRAGQATITVTDLTPASTTSITGVSLPISGAAAGIWNVTVINPDGQESGNLTTFTVTPPPPVASFSATPNHGNMPLSVSFTDESTGGTPTGWAWYFGDENYLGTVWTRQTSSAAWPARYMHTSVVLPDGSIILMGGYSSTYLDDTWRSTDQGKTWTEQNSSSGWEARDGHTSVALPDGSIVLMGGRSTSTYYNDTWQSTDQGKTWTEQNSSSGWEARYDSTSVALPDGSIALMGGYSPNIGYCNDTWRSTDLGKTWTEQNSSSGWEARYGSTSVALPDGSIVLMGGRSTIPYNNDTWRSTDQGKTWTEQNSTGWGGRLSPASVALPDGSVILMGGRASSNYNDTWRSTDQGETWTEQTSSAAWPARYRHTSVALSDGSIVLMGGWSGSDPYNDVWRFVTANATQSPVHTYTAAGTYTVALQDYNAGGYNSTLKSGYIIVTTSTTPTITSINPNSGTNTSSVTVSITGTNFNTTGTTTVNLTRAGQANLTVTGLTPASTTSITGVSLPISGAAAGIWNVTVINPDG